MKRYILKRALFGCLIVISAAGCTHSAKEEADKGEDANNITIAKQDSSQAKQDSINDEQKYKQETEVTINENKSKIAKLKEEIKEEREEIRDKYEKELDNLEQENEKLETRLNEYKEEGVNKWKKFKYDFNKDLDSLGKSISRIGERGMHKSK
jgi:septal ring factor EnvC (AmiA/AmiB activator)